jgi:hypothetical protein
LVGFIEKLCSFELLSAKTFIHPIVLRRVFRPRWDEIVCGWREFCNGELHNLYSSPDIIRITKSKRMRWARYIAHVGTKRNADRETQKERDH